MKNTKRILCLFLALSMLLSILCACSNDEKGGDNDTSKGTSNVDDNYNVPHLQKRDLDGFTLTYLSALKEESFNGAQYAPEEILNEPVNDAFYDVNNFIKGNYNCDIKVTYLEDGWTKVQERVRADIMGGLSDYDVVSTGIITLAPMAVEGNLLDFRTLKNSSLKLDEDWWDPTTQKDLTLAEGLYFLNGDLIVTDDDYTYAMYFNKDIIENHQLENPYDLAYDDRWTLDQMYSMIKDVAVEGGSGAMDMNGDDTWGLVGVSFDLYKLIVGCGSPMVTKNSDDLPIIAVENESNINTFLSCFEIITDTQSTAVVEGFYAWNDPDAHNVSDHFYNGKALFFPNHINTVSTEKMRSAEIHYGILPLPKYDENQENYCSTIEPYRFGCISLPSFCKDIDKTTYVLELSAYLRKQHVTDVYYTTTIKNKRFVDDDSPEMLDKIFSNRIVDLAVIFNWADCIQLYNNMFFAKSTDIISYMESHGETIQIAIDETIEALRKLSEKAAE